MFFISNLSKPKSYRKQKINQGINKDITRNANRKEVGGLGINTQIKLKVKKINWRKKGDFNVAKNYTVMTKGRDAIDSLSEIGDPHLSEVLRPKPSEVLSPLLSYVPSKGCLIWSVKSEKDPVYSWTPLLAHFLRATYLKAQWVPHGNLPGI